jgi:hypothetical protein
MTGVQVRYRINCFYCREVVKRYKRGALRRREIEFELADTKCEVLEGLLMKIQFFKD